MGIRATSATSGEEQREAMLARAMWLLGSTQRMHILKVLVKHQGGISVRDLATLIGLSQPAVSAHLLGMERAGLLRCFSEQRSDGRYAYYSVNSAAIAVVLRQYRDYIGLEDIEVSLRSHC